MRATLQQVVRDNPEYVFPILEATQQPGPSFSPPESEQSPWCRCTFCREMPDAIEKVCCQKTTG